MFPVYSWSNATSNNFHIQKIWTVSSLKEEFFRCLKKIALNKTFITFAFMSVNGHPVSRGWISSCELECYFLHTNSHCANVASARIGVK